MQKMRILVFIISIGFLACNSNGKQSAVTADDTVAPKQVSITDSIPAESAFSAAKLKSVQEKMQQIRLIKKWKQIRKIELNESTEGGEATYFFTPEGLTKITAVYYGETGKQENEFYLNNGKLFLTVERETQYNRPVYWDSAHMKENNDTESFNPDKAEVMTDSSFFENGNQFYHVNSQDCGAPFAKDYLLSEQKRLQQELDKLTALLKTGN